MQSVTHEEVYSQINNGDIMFVANFNHPLARVIQFATRSPYSHIAILFWVTVPGGDKRLMVIEAQGGTTRRVQDFDFYCKRPLQIVAAPKDWMSYESTALEYIGEEKYGYFEAFYSGLRDFCYTYFGISLPKKDFKGEICSEFVARCLGLNSINVTPQDVFTELNLPIKFSVNG